jgi:HSP20 family protein
LSLYFVEKCRFVPFMSDGIRIDLSRSNIQKTKKYTAMTLVKVNNRPAFRSFDGLVNELFGNLDGYTARNWNSNLPPVNIIENEEGYHLEIAAPGRNKEAFKVKVENNQLAISYEDKKETETKELKQVRREFTVSSFQRSFNLNDKVNAEGIQAKYEDGILKVFVPKKEEAKPLAKEITIG